MRPIRHHSSLELPEGPGLGRSSLETTQLHCGKLIRLVGLIGAGEKPDQLVRLDQDGDGDTDERQDPGDV
jgi:hypothetical protein